MSTRTTRTIKLIVNYNAPGEARSSPTQVIVRYSDTSSEYDTVEFSESDPSKPIYAPFDLYDDKAALFLS